MTLGKWLLIGSGVIASFTVIAAAIGRQRVRATADELVEALIQDISGTVPGPVDLGSFSKLPPPVARYFKRVLMEGQNLICSAKIHQSGELRTSTMSKNWSSFTAIQTVVPPVHGFVWNAKVRMPLGTHVRVRDAYNAGVGSGQVSLLSAFVVDSEVGTPELNSGALHRYLAEAVWFPTALLPQSGVGWTPIDDRTALATLTVGETTVSLEFRFNEVGEVSSIYSAGRYGRFGGAYKQVPWEGHFRDYRAQAGMRVPSYGKVGWYIDRRLEIVWKGNLVAARYGFGS